MMSSKEITKYINKERLVQTFLELVNINSPSFREREIGNYVIERLRALGFKVDLQDYGKSFNILAFKRGDKLNTNSLLLGGHLDTIESTEGIQYSVKGNLIKTVGDTVLGADDKSAIAEVLETLSVLEELNIPHCNLEVVLTSAEEKGLVGAKSLDYHKLRSKYGLVFDSNGTVGGIVLAAPTHDTYSMKITGKSAHAGIEPENGISAIMVSSRIISEIPDGRIDKETTANIGVIKGGSATNVVPKDTIIEGEVRSHNIETLESLKRQIFGTAKRITTKSQALIDITEQRQYHAFKIEESDPFVQFIERVMRECQIEPYYIISGGGSDTSIFNNYGIKTLNLSSGMQQPHTTNEYIDIDDLNKASTLLLQAIMEFSNISEACLRKLIY